MFPGIAQAESVNVFDVGVGNLLIYRSTDDGNIRSSLAIKTDGGYVEFDDRGNSRIINDFSGDDEDREDRD